MSLFLANFFDGSILKALYYELGTKEYLLLLSTIDDKYYITIYVCTDCEYIEHDTIDLQVVMQCIISCVV